MKKRSIIAIGLMALGIAFIVLGVYRGDTDSVLVKATMICMECIGLG